MNEFPLPLVLAVVDAFLLLEGSSNDEIDPDVAVRGMENVAANLLTFSEDDQRALREQLAAIGASCEDSYFGQFVSGLADMVGLAG